MDDAIKQKILHLYPAFGSMTAAALDRVLDEALVRTVPAGTVMFDESNPCQAFPMLIEGTISVSKVAANGRELQLYRVVPGESCLLTSSCLLGNVPYSARGTAESEVTVVALPPDLFNRLVAEYEPFRTYIFSLFAERISDLMQLVEAVAFHRLDQRLAALLLGKGRTIQTTHQQLAEELGSVREIVSRLLKSFAEQGLVALSRERIEVLNPQELRRIAGAT
ncbi:MAG: Crp/Fnr family transcriptional regulator [Betaproteobacteria bacterium]|nr:Crp/Fnr family transcriptional regulator [Betaproteobacteria bacterium]